MSDIAKRLRASIAMDAIHGSGEERNICGRQMMFAADWIDRLEAIVATITHCERCGGDWVDNGLSDGCACEQIAELKARVKLLEMLLHAASPVVGPDLANEILIALRGETSEEAE